MKKIALKNSASKVLIFETFGRSLAMMDLDNGENVARYLSKTHYGQMLTEVT